MSIRELPFSIPVSGVIHINGDVVTITVNRAETNISLETGVTPGKRISLQAGMTMYLWMKTEIPSTRPFWTLTACFVGRGWCSNSDTPPSHTPRRMPHTTTILLLSKRLLRHSAETQKTP